MAEYVNFGMSMVAGNKVKFAAANNGAARLKDRAGLIVNGKEERMFFIGVGASEAMTKNGFAAHLLKDAVDMERFMDAAKTAGWTEEEVLKAVRDTAGKATATADDVEAQREAARARIAARAAAANE